mmetsp:Transcript_33375/g.76187  ORF Transcript_33375/g.76187 Transcript_33375/m.76187 type:complete len:211 (-) Transcript_33375:349-981(-)
MMKTSIGSTHLHQWRREGIVLWHLQEAPVPATCIWRVGRSLDQVVPAEEVALIYGHADERRWICKKHFMLLLQPTNSVSRGLPSPTLRQILVMCCRSVAKEGIVVQDRRVCYEGVLLSHTSTPCNALSPSRHTTFKAEHASASTRHFVTASYETIALLLDQCLTPRATSNTERHVSLRENRATASTLCSFRLELLTKLHCSIQPLEPFRV